MRVTGPDHEDQHPDWWALERPDGSEMDDWDEGSEDDEPAPAWRRPVLVAVAIVTAIALASVPIYNVIFARSVADNGLEVCGFDYCVVQEAVRDAGLDSTMSALAHTFLDEAEARAFADELTDHLGIDRIGLVVATRLEGRLGGVYEPSTRSISIESPARAWTVLHEVAHAVQAGHGEAFQEVVIDLAEWSETSRP